MLDVIGIGAEKVEELNADVRLLNRGAPAAPGHVCRSSQPRTRGGRTFLDRTPDAMLRFRILEAPRPREPLRRLPALDTRFHENETARTAGMAACMPIPQEKWRGYVAHALHPPSATVRIP